jgi:hypothetical protein
MNRRDMINDITYLLTHLKVQVELQKRLNLQDLSVHSENFFRDFLNLILGLDLVNINIVNPNAIAIDLGDKNRRIAIQVTSTSEVDKIKHTYKGFVKRGLFAEYDKLVVLIVGEKKAYKEKSLNDESGFEMSLSDDVWGVTELFRKVGDLQTPELRKCLEFLRTELQNANPHESKEVKTLIHLIAVLSAEEEGLHLGDNREDPDPKGKIDIRFAEHADFLKNLYADLHEIYGRTLAEVNRHADLSHVRIRKLQIYLSTWSDKTLNECGGDPQKALDALTEKVLHKMAVSDVDFDDSAVRYYLIHQLILCNVFPNKQGIHA